MSVTYINHTRSLPNTRLARLRIGVFMGGRSIENEVSFNSGRTICDHLDTTHYDVIPIFQTRSGILYILPWHFLHRGKTTDFQHRLSTQAQCIGWDDLKDTVDFIYIATHGRYAEDGTLQGFLEILGIPYLGAKVFGSALRMDKIIHKSFLKMHGIDVPRYFAIYTYQLDSYKKNPHLLFDALAAHGITDSYIVKPHNEGSSLGISVVTDANQLLDAVYKAMYIDSQKPTAVIIEEKINGMEFSCITLQDYQHDSYIALPPTEIVPCKGTLFFDYEQKYMPGRAIKYTPARCDLSVTKKIQAVCQRVMHIMEFKTISRIDGFVTDDNRIVIIDPNSLSGMGPASFLFLQAAEIDMSHTTLINHLIKVELRHYNIVIDNAFEKLSTRESSMNIKIRVAVIMGGNSNEKEISLESGRNVTYKLSPHKYEIIPLFLTSTMQLYHINQSLLVRNSTQEIESLVTPDTCIKWSDLPQHVDFVFNALHGGYGENGSIQGALEMLNIAYNGSGVLTSALCMDKYKTNSFLSHHGFCVPTGHLVHKNEWLNDRQAVINTVVATIPLPVIVKPSDDGCSVMVCKARDVITLTDAINTIFASGKDTALIEECIIGVELTVGVIGNQEARALPPSQIIMAGDILSIEEKFLPGAGENQTPAQLPPTILHHIQETIERAYTVLQCKGYARIDCFYQTAKQSPTAQERIIILEVNTLPGLTPATCIFHQAAEIDIRPMDFIDLIITLGFEQHATTSVEVDSTSRTFTQHV